MGNNMYQNVVTHNPLGGKCLHDCSYCSTNSMRWRKPINEKYSGEPRIYKHELKNLGSGKTIFEVAQNDLFAGNVPIPMINEILDNIRKYPDNIYFLQTKNPKRFQEIKRENNWFLGATIESDICYPKIMRNAPAPADRAVAMTYVDPIRFITIEPILRFNLNCFLMMLEYVKPNFVYIGADSKNNNLPEPSKEEVLQLITELKKFTEVRIKSNLTRIIGNEFPERRM